MNVLVFDVKKRVLFRGHGKMLSSYKHPVRLATQLSALAVHRRWLGKLRRSGTEDFRSGNMEWRHTDTTDKEELFQSIHEWMNGLCRVSTCPVIYRQNSARHRSITRSQVSSAAWVFSVSVKGKPTYFVSMADKKKAVAVWWLTQTVTDCGFCHISWIYLEAAAHFTQQVLPIL